MIFIQIWKTRSYAYYTGFKVPLFCVLSCRERIGGFLHYITILLILLFVSLKSFWAMTLIIRYIIFPLLVKFPSIFAEMIITSWCCTGSILKDVQLLPQKCKETCRVMPGRLYTLCHSCDLNILMNLIQNDITNLSYLGEGIFWLFQLLKQPIKWVTK